MTTKPSSSRRASSGPKTLFDAICQPVELGDELGRGGEGSVYELASDPSLVVKVYHKTPLDEPHVAKLRAMTAVWSADLEKISAWPRTILFDPQHKQPCGLLMSKMSGALPLHELYGTTNRRRHFPDSGWHHMVLAARNAAAAFNTLHSAGIVVGDVNQGNLLVDQKMTVRMIDCDSFQIVREGVLYNCPVGSPHFTPPELQGLRLRDVERTQNHDRFGLATLIFHLLFVGRHPFAGRYRGPGDMSIEKAIAERRFAFSKNRAATQIEPPPASLLLEDIPQPIGDLFETAFRATGDAQRPTPAQWIEQLELLIKRRRTCDTDPLHVYSADSRQCPWCRIEDVGGPSFFVAANMASTVTSNRLVRLDAKVNLLDYVPFPQLPIERITPPRLTRIKGMKPLKSINSLDAAAVVLVLSWIACIVGAIYSLPVLIGGAVLSLASAGFLLANKTSKSGREKIRTLLRSIYKQGESLLKRARTIDRQHRNRLAVFEESAKDLEDEKRNYRAEGDDLARVIVQSRHTQMDDYLREHSIRESCTIYGLTQSHITMLESYGVESAYDLERIKLYGVPSMSSTLMIELLNWRAELERKFEFKPEHGVTLDNLKSLQGAAVQRFKMSQARKILMGDERLRGLAKAGKEALVQALTEFDAEAKQWRKTAEEYVAHQKTRTLVERTLNRAPAAMFLAPAVLIPALTGLVYYLMQ
jgi:DNA-binding helix-hairpin-helix protein with protein kinase domain